MTSVPNEKVMDELIRAQEEMSCVLQVVALKAYHCGKKEQLIKDTSIVCYRFNMTFKGLPPALHRQQALSA